MSIRAHQNGTGTGHAGARPGDYAVGSQQSRAATRALMQRRFAGRIARTIILSAETDSDCKEPRFGEWREGADGTLGRICFLPDGMTMEEAERIVAECTSKRA